MKNRITQMLKVWDHAVSPQREMVAYEYLWATPHSTRKSVSSLFSEPDVFPTQVVHHQKDMFSNGDLFEKVSAYLSEKKGFSISMEGCFQYPSGMRDLPHPVKLFYYKGDIGLTESRCVSVVGARDCTDEGQARAQKIATILVNNNITVVSGLAKGIDTAVMRSVLQARGRLIGVVGTPIDECYPKENDWLHEDVADNHLLISQVPFYRYKHEAFKARKRYFPERNQTMAALSEATIIVEASDRSGTLTQARACIQQGRKLLILNSCFENPGITWPQHYLKKGAIRVKSVEDVLGALGSQ